MTWPLALAPFLLVCMLVGLGCLTLSRKGQAISDERFSLVMIGLILASAGVCLAFLFQISGRNQ